MPKHCQVEHAGHALATTYQEGRTMGHVEAATAVSDEDPARDRGSTFVEVVVTIVLVGVIIVPLLAAVRTSIRASSVAESAVVETVLVNAVDRVNRAAITDCDFTGEVKAAVETRGWPAGAATVEHAYLQSDGSWSPTQGPLDCEDQVRLITVTITHPDANITRTLEVVKGDL
jgi:type II secretory pathway pseudopilin PulG